MPGNSKVSPIAADQFHMNTSFVRLGSAAVALLIASRLVAAESVPEKPTITVESDSLRLSVGGDAHILEFTNKSSGTNYCTRNPSAAFARVNFPHTNDDLVTTLVYLDDATEENGCLQVLPETFCRLTRHPKG